MRFFTFELYRDRQKQWRWRLIAPNGRKVAGAGEGYHNRTHAERMARKIGNGLPGYVVVDRQRKRGASGW